MAPLFVLQVVSKLQKYMHDPHLRYRTTITVMPVKIFHQNPPKDAFLAGDFLDTRPKKSSTSKSVSPRDNKKLWANKYPKSVCHHLVSFIERQETLPQLAKPAEPAKKRPTNQQARRVAPKPRSAPASKKTTENDRKMLSNMGLLASIDKNGLETNIQKIIEMIELKIIDIISDPAKQNPNTFSEIEQEIMDVLEKMRSVEAAAPSKNKQGVGDRAHTYA